MFKQQLAEPLSPVIFSHAENFGQILVKIGKTLIIQIGQISIDFFLILVKIRQIFGHFFLFICQNFGQKR